MTLRCNIVKIIHDISTHTPLAGRDLSWQQVAARMGHISTHTPLAGRDMTSSAVEKILLISTHTPLAGRDNVRSGHVMMISSFLLTRPSRDVTLVELPHLFFHAISTHTPLAGRDED